MKTENTVWHPSDVSRDDRWKAAGGHTGMTVWLTGLSGSGKSSIAVELERQLIEAGRPGYLLDGDNMRQGLNGDLGFSAEDRDENVRRVAHVARLFADAGVVAIVPLISPYRAARDFARSLHEAADLPFIEVFVDTPLEVCRERDPNGLYEAADRGEIPQFPGVSSTYERPTDMDLRVDTSTQSTVECVELIIALMAERGFLDA